MDFDFQPALDFYSSLRKNGKNHDDAFNESLIRFDLKRPVILGKFKIKAEEIDSGIKMKEWVKEQKGKIAENKWFASTPQINDSEKITDSTLPEEEKEDKMEQWHEGAYGKKRR